MYAFLLLMGFFTSFSLNAQARSALKANSPALAVFDEIKTERLTLTPDAPTPPVDISFLCADMKYRDGELKICEFGEGKNASRTASTVSYGGTDLDLYSPYWAIVWEYLARLELPIWFVGKDFLRGGSEHKKMFGLKEFNRVGAGSFPSLDALESSESFKALMKETGNKRPKALRKFDGIVIYRYRDHRKKNRLHEYKNFQKKYPTLLTFNHVSHEFGQNKFQLAALIERAGLSQFRPRWKIYPKQYTANLASTIKQDLNSRLFVIKPINSARSNGVIMTSGKQLDATLREILLRHRSSPTAPSNPNLLNHCPGQSETYSYWQGDKNDSFIVETLEESKRLAYKGKTYDPTMRAVFMLLHDRGHLSFTLLGAYWELPPAHLDAPAPLTEKHRTVAEEEGTIAGLRVSPTDLATVRELLGKFLLPLYQQMLAEKA